MVHLITWLYILIAAVIYCCYWVRNLLQRRRYQKRIKTKTEFMHEFWIWIIYPLMTNTSKIVMVPNFCFIESTFPSSVFIPEDFMAKDISYSAHGTDVWLNIHHIVPMNPSFLSFLIKHKLCWPKCPNRFHSIKKKWQ